MDRRLTKDEQHWFNERMYETSAGRLVIKKNLISKYMKLTGEDDPVKSWMRLQDIYNSEY